MELLSFGYLGGGSGQSQSQSQQRDTEREREREHQSQQYGSSSSGGGNVVRQQRRKDEEISRYGAPKIRPTGGMSEARESVFTGSSGSRYKRGHIAGAGSGSSSSGRDAGSYQPSLLAMNAGSSITGTGSVKFPSTGKVGSHEGRVGSRGSSSGSSGYGERDSGYGQKTSSSSSSYSAYSSQSDQRYRSPASSTPSPSLGRVGRSLSHGAGADRQAYSSSSSSSSAKPVLSRAASASASGGLVCDKCDGKHDTDACPHFKKQRDDHPDAQKNFYKKLGVRATLTLYLILILTLSF